MELLVSLSDQAIRIRRYHGEDPYDLLFSVFKVFYERRDVA